MGTAPQVVVPVRDAPVGVDGALHIHRHGRAVGLPSVLLLAHPAQLDRPPGEGAGDQRRVRRRIVGPVMAVASGPGDMRDADLLLRHPQHLGDRLAVGIDPLRMRGDGELIALHHRHRAGRADRAVHHVGPIERAAQRALALRHAGRTRLGDGARLLHVVAQPVMDPALLGKRLPLLPLRRALQRPHGEDRLELLLRHDGEEVAVAMRADHAGHRLHLGGLDRDQPRIGAGRAHHAGVDHPLGPQVLDIVLRAGDDLRDVDPLKVATIEAPVLRRAQAARPAAPAPSGRATRPADRSPPHRRARGPRCPRPSARRCRRQAAAPPLPKAAGAHWRRPCGSPCRSPPSSGWRR